jgi:hypothetical protein
VSNSFEIDDWIIAQHEDIFCQTIMVEQDKPVGERRKFDKQDEFQILPNGLLANAEGKIVVPAKLRKEILVRFHDHKLAAHQGIEKTIAKIRAKYFWPKLAKDVRIHIINCLTCAKRKVAGTCKAPLQPFPIAEYIWQRMAMDIVGPVPVSQKGNNHILVMLEYVTRYAIAVPLKSTTAQTIIRKFIKHVVNEEGIPSEILTDQGTNFMSNAMKEMCTQLGIKQLRTTIYHPQTDGAVERVNRTIIDMVTPFAHKDPKQWDEHLDYVVAAYNRTPHASTGETPFFLLKGRDALEPTDLRPPMRNRFLTDQNNVFSQQWREAVELAKSKLIVAQERQKHYYDRSVKECSFSPNDVVLLKILGVQTGKFYMRWEGPYVIVDKLSEQNFVVRHQEDDFQVVVHVNRLRKWNGDPKYKHTVEIGTTNGNQTIPPNVTNNSDATTAANENVVINENAPNLNVATNDASNLNDASATINVPPVENPTSIVVTPVQIGNQTETAPAAPEVNQTIVPVKRRPGRPKKGQAPPKSTIPPPPPPPHTHALRRSIRMPQ